MHKKLKAAFLAATIISGSGAAMAQDQDFQSPHQIYNEHLQQLDDWQRGTQFDDYERPDPMVEDMFDENKSINRVKQSCDRYDVTIINMPRHSAYQDSFSTLTSDSFIYAMEDCNVDTVFLPFPMSVQKDFDALEDGQITVAQLQQRLNNVEMDHNRGRQSDTRSFNASLQYAELAKRLVDTGTKVSATPRGHSNRYYDLEQDLKQLVKSQLGQKEQRYYDLYTNGRSDRIPNADIDRFEQKLAQILTSDEARDLQTQMAQIQAEQGTGYNGRRVARKMAEESMIGRAVMLYNGGDINALKQGFRQENITSNQVTLKPGKPKRGHSWEY